MINMSASKCKLRAYQAISDVLQNPSLLLRKKPLNDDSFQYNPPLKEAQYAIHY